MDKINIDNKLDQCITKLMRKIKKKEELEIISWSYVFSEYNNEWIVILKVIYQGNKLKPLVFNTWANCEIFTKDVLQKLEKACKNIE